MKYFFQFVCTLIFCYLYISPIQATPSLNKTLNTNLVNDTIPPVATCILYFHISLLPEQLVPDVPVMTIWAEDFDAGSYDDMGEITFKVARTPDGENEEMDFQPTIDLYQEDFPKNITITLMVTDAAGNKDFCKMSLTTKIQGVSFNYYCNSEMAEQLNTITNDEDRIEYLTAEFKSQLDTFPIIVEGCPLAEIQITSISPNPTSSNCFNHNFSFDYYLIDVCGNISSWTKARIHLINLNDWSVAFPADIILYEEEGIPLELPTLAEATLINNGCTNWTATIERNTDTIVHDGYYDIINMYKIIDSCRITPISSFAMVERPMDLILNEEETLSLRYTDLNFDRRNDYDDLDGDADIYNNTIATFDADFVKLSIDENNSIPHYQYVSNFSGDSTTYVSAHVNAAFAYQHIIRVYPATSANSPVYPGDANTDGVANNFDLLTIGLSYGTEGFARPSGNLSWRPQYSEDWGIMTVSGIDFKHSDTDANGIIDTGDVLGIVQNWGRNVGLSPSPVAEAFSSDGIPFFIGDEARVEDNQYLLPIILGTEEMPAESVYGLAFSVSYTKEANSPDFNFLYASIETSWLSDQSNDLLFIQRHFPEEQRIDIAISRKDQQSRMGAGEIAQLSIGVEDVILQNTLEEKGSQEVKFIINDVRIINSNEDIQKVATLSQTIIIGSNVTSTTQTWNTREVVNIYPNPTKDYLYISSTSNIEQAIIFDIQGNKIRHFNTPNNKLNVQELESGIYFLQLFTAEGIITKRFQHTW